MRDCTAFDVYAIDASKVNRVCPEEMRAIEALMTAEDGWGQFAKCAREPIVYGDLAEHFEKPEAIMAAFDRLTTAFEQRTGLALDVEFCGNLESYHGPHIDGCVFTLFNVTQFTPAARAMVEDFDRYCWVVCQ